MLIFAFIAACLGLVLQAVLFLPFTLLPFVPFIALVSMRSSLSKSLWLSAFCGALVDLISDDPIGMHALNYTLSAALTHRLKKHFTYETSWHISLFSSLISFVSTILQLLLLFLFDRRIPFSGKWIFSDWLIMPLADGIFALVWFAGPLVVYAKFWSRYWRSIKQTLFPTSP